MSMLKERDETTKGGSSVLCLGGSCHNDCSCVIGIKIKTAGRVKVKRIHLTILSFRLDNNVTFDGELLQTLPVG